MLMFVIQESFIISDTIDGSATSYTITYADSLSGSTCSSSTISASLCESGTCRHLYQVSNSSCPPCVDINITVFASNILGNGSTSDVITIGCLYIVYYTFVKCIAIIVFFILGSTNSLVQVEFDALLSSAQCIFMQPTRNEKSCSIVYGPGEDCSNLSLSSESGITTLNYVTIIEGLLIPQLQSGSKVCWMVTASDGPHIARVEGILTAGILFNE